MKAALLPLALGVIVTASCSSGKATAGGTESSAPKASVEAPVEPTTETVEVRDPVEDAFTVQLPKGWNNRAYSARAYDIHRMVSYSVSPDGDTLIYRGDPSMPNYWTPEAANPMTRDFAKANPLMKIEAFRPADEFLPAYVTRKFGKLDGFSMGEYQPDPDVEAQMIQAFAKHGLEIQPSCGRQHFSFNDKGKKVNAVVHLSLAYAGGMYTVDVGGISTQGDPKDYESMLTAIRSSEKMNPAWQKKMQQQHQQIMADIQAATEAMTARHNQNMAWIQNSAARHQKRMQALWAQSDASMNSYWERSAASDLSHQRFINYINDENTVVSSSGKTFQVDNSYDKYFVNTSTGEYVGGQSNWDVDKVRSLGLNPSDYEEVKIRN